MPRLDKFTLERKKVETYSDFLSNFSRNPKTGILAKVTNEESIKQSLRNIVLTNVGERFYDSNKGSKIRQSLFEPLSPDTLDVIQIQLRECIALYEPRVTVEAIRIDDNLDSNGYNVTIVFSIINIPNEQFDLSVIIERVR